MVGLVAGGLPREGVGPGVGSRGGVEVGQGDGEESFGDDSGVDHVGSGLEVEVLGGGGEPDDAAVEGGEGGEDAGGVHPAAVGDGGEDGDVELAAPVGLGGRDAGEDGGQVVGEEVLPAAAGLDSEGVAGRLGEPGGHGGVDAAGDDRLAALEAFAELFGGVAGAAREQMDGVGGAGGLAVAEVSDEVGEESSCGRVGGGASDEVKLAEDDGALALGAFGERGVAEVEAGVEEGAERGAVRLLDDG